MDPICHWLCFSQFRHCYGGISFDDAVRLQLSWVSYVNSCMNDVKNSLLDFWVAIYLKAVTEGGSSGTFGVLCIYHVLLEVSSVALQPSIRTLRTAEDSLLFSHWLIVLVNHPACLDQLVLSFSMCITKIGNLTWRPNSYLIDTSCVWLQRSLNVISINALLMDLL